MEFGVEEVLTDGVGDGSGEAGEISVEFEGSGLAKLEELADGAVLELPFIVTPTTVAPTTVPASATVTSTFASVCKLSSPGS